MIRALAIALTVGAVSLVVAGSGEAQNEPQVAPIPKQCSTPTAQNPAQPVLRNVANAMRTRKRIVILAIGGTSSSHRGPVAGGNFAVVERLLEGTFKSLDVQIVHRGVSGELVADAGRRIRNEVALTGADLVLWQVGTADAMARVDADAFSSDLDDTLAWLKARDIDVILVGMRYAKGLANDPSYQAMRKAISTVADRNGVLRINRYAAEESLTGAAQNPEFAPSSLEASESSYQCTAEYLARAIAAGLFLRKPGIGDSQLPRRTH